MTSSYAVTDPTNLHDNGYTTDQTNYRESSVFARWVFRTDATYMHLKTWNTIYGSYPAWTHIGVLVNEALNTTLEAVAANAQQFEVTLPAGHKAVELVAGLQSKPAATLLGTFLKSVYFAGGITKQISPSTLSDRVVVYGDSITVGANATYPTSEGWPVLLRANIPIAVEAWGYRTLYDDAHTVPLRAALVAQLASFGPGAIWLAIGTNDYGLEEWSAADFGTAYAALMDDLHVALPSATIYCQTPIERTDESANIFGDTLGDYRTQIATAVSTRTAFAILVDGTDVAFPQSPGDLDDGTHPTTAGHAKYYAAVKAVLGV